MVAEDDLLEWAVVHKAARYGTPAAPVELALAAGRPAMLEIDLQGARQVRRDDAGRAVRLPQAAVVGGAGPPAGRPRHRDARRSGSAGSPPPARSWPPSRSSTSPSSTTKFTLQPSSW